MQQNKNSSGRVKEACFWFGGVYSVFLRSWLLGLELNDTKETGMWKSGERTFLKKRISGSKVLRQLQVHVYEDGKRVVLNEAEWIEL